jgi:Tfp pilus assembly protein PilF
MIRATIWIFLIIFNGVGTQAQNCASLFITAGMNASNVGKYKQAVKDFTIALECDSSQERAYLGRGVAEAFLRENQAAIQDYDKAIALNPNDATAYFDRGISSMSFS